LVNLATDSPGDAPYLERSMTRDFVKAGILAVLGWLAMAASGTPTLVDDKAVEVGKAIVEEELLFDWFFGMATADDDGGLALMGDAPVALQAVLERRKIDWAQVVSVATTLVGLFRMFAGK
jgi:hypothetical protein